MASQPQDFPTDPCQTSCQSACEACCQTACQGECQSQGQQASMVTLHAGESIYKQCASVFPTDAYRRCHLIAQHDGPHKHQHENGGVSEWDHPLTYGEKVEAFLNTAMGVSTIAHHVEDKPKPTLPEGERVFDFTDEPTAKPIEDE